MVVACMNPCMRPFRTDDGTKSTWNRARARTSRRVTSMDPLVVWKQVDWVVKDPSPTLLGRMTTRAWVTQSCSLLCWFWICARLCGWLSGWMVLLSLTYTGTNTDHSDENNTMASLSWSLSTAPTHRGQPFPNPACQIRVQSFYRSGWYYCYLVALIPQRTSCCCRRSLSLSPTNQCCPPTIPGMDQLPRKFFSFPRRCPLTMIYATPHLPRLVVWEFSCCQCHGANYNGRDHGRVV